jgi:PPOX class probable F420-dependent enzyme
MTAADEGSTDSILQPDATVFATLASASYASVTTYRRTGVAVPTAVWSAPDAGHLLVWTGAESGKVKRLRHTATVTVAPCDARGRLNGDPVPAQARIMDRDEMPRVRTAMVTKYGWQFRMSAAGAAIGRVLGIARPGQIGLEITLAPPSAPDQV